MSGPFKCRVIVAGGGDCFLPGGECDLPAAIGLVTEMIPDHIHDGKPEPSPILVLHPVCEAHAPEEVHEAQSSMAPTEWAIVTLAYGAAGGDLR